MAVDILYHYCPNNAFHSIIENSSIRLSSLSLANDSMEGKLVAEIMGRIAKADGLDKASTVFLQESVSKLEQVFDGLGFCLSEEGDLLSQWRGYANDATGVSIGFSKPYLEQFAMSCCGIPGKSGISLKRVEYEPDKQEDLIKPTYVQIKELIGEGALKNSARYSILDAQSGDEAKGDNEIIELAFKNLSLTVVCLFAELFSLKTNAFREEKEWRLISPFTKTIGGSCSFRALNDRIVPFREYGLMKPESASIMEVILGPKNTTPDYVVESLLKQSGFPDVNVKRSEASYR